MLRLHEATYLSLPFQFILSKRLSNDLRRSNAVLLFEEFSVFRIYYPFCFSTLLTSSYCYKIISYFCLHNPKKKVLKN